MCHLNRSRLHHQNYYHQQNACMNTIPTTDSVSSSTDSLFTDEMVVSKRIVLYNYFFIRGFIRALTREENEELGKSILNEMIKEIGKIINKLYYRFLL